MDPLEKQLRQFLLDYGYPTVGEFWEAYDLAMLELQEIAPVLALMRQHDTTWHDLEFSQWLPNLVEEIGELASSITGKHDDHPHWELMQIASICLNWLRLFSTNAQMTNLLAENQAG